MKVSVIEPDSITVGHYVDYLTELSPIKQAAIASEMSAGDVRNLPQSVIDFIRTKFEENMEAVQPSFQTVVKLEGVDYGLHPEIDRMTGGEFFDLESCEKNWIKNIPKALCVLYRPIVTRWKDRYNIEPYTEKHFSNEELMRTLPLSVASGAVLFFSTLRNDLMQSLEKNQAKDLREIVSNLKEELKEASLTNGVGFTS